jgi:hypothetical protein
VSKECTLTTFDNPFDPFEQFIPWFLFDIEKGYYTCAKLGRIAKLQPDFTQNETNEEVERAVNFLLDHDFLGIYQKVYKNTAEPTVE